MAEALRWVDEAGTAHERCWLYFDAGDDFPVEFDPGAHPEMGWPRCGWAFYCRDCGDIWRKILMFNSSHMVLPLDMVEVACRIHYDHYNIPGSILVGRLEGLLPLLPEMMLQEEFDAHLAYAERQLKGVANAESEDCPEEGAASAPARVQFEGAAQAGAGGGNGEQGQPVV